MITHKLRKKKLNSIVTESLIGDGKLDILHLTSTKHLYFAVPKKYYTKFYALCYYENSKQTTALPIVFNHLSD